VLEFPRAGLSREQLAPGLRACFCDKDAIYYTHDEDAVTVIRVLYGGRDANAIAAHGEFSSDAYAPIEMELL
jgi:plasmid stabilization system protein ParE